MHRGLTLIELMISLAITAIVAVAISGAMTAVNVGVNSRRDARSVMVRTSASHARVGAYINSCRAIVEADADGLVIWLNDDREGRTIHASELRWLAYDASAGTVDVYFVDFPDSWTQTMRELNDLEYPKNTDWNVVFTTYDAGGLMASVTLVDGLNSFGITLDAVQVFDARHVVFDVGVTHESGVVDMLFGSTIRHHAPPAH